MLLNRANKAVYRSPTLLDNWQPSLPSYVSGTNKKIADLQKQYLALINAAKSFYNSNENISNQLAKSKTLITEYETQIEFLEDYQRTHGKLPKIKDQESSQRYLIRLYHLLEKKQAAYNRLHQQTINEQQQRAELLDSICLQLVESLSGLRAFNRFIGSLVLAAPSANAKNRCLRNENSKPLCVAALAMIFFDQLRRGGNLQCKQLQQECEKILNPENCDKDYSLTAEKADDSKNVRAQTNGEVIDEDRKKQYQAAILIPLVRAALIQNIGSYSPQADALRGEDRYQLLTSQTRKDYLACIYKQSMLFLSDACLWDEKNIEQTNSLVFTHKILAQLQTSCDPLGDILRLPMVVSSILLSSKPNFHYQQMPATCDILQRGAQQKDYTAEYALNMQKLIGRFPIGCGIYFIQQENGEIEKGIVSSLLPFDIDEPITKQITRRQLHFVCNGELIVQKESNLFFAQTRELSAYSKRALKQKFADNYTWDVAVFWDIQIPSNQFWRYDGTLNLNGRYFDNR